MRLIGWNYAQQAATTVTASTSNPNFPVSNIKNEFRAKEWRSTSNASQWVVFDTITTEEINSVVLLWQKGQYKLSDSATITVQANPTNVWTSPAVSQVLTFSDTYEMASHYFSSAQSYRYWRILIDDSTNVHGYVNLGVVILGHSEELDNPDNGFTYSQSDLSVKNVTAYGHEYVDEYPILDSLGLNFKVMDFNSTLALTNLYRQVGSRLPVFITLDSAASVFGKDTFAIYGKFDPTLNFTHISYDILDGSAVIKEVS